MNDFLLGIASFGLVLIPLVIIHEFGHFIAAKLSGITVLEFGIGFPPRAAVLFSKGDTIYTLNWLPIGGFVRPYGEDFVRPKTEEELSFDRQEIMERGIENPKSVFEANPWQRMFFMAAGPGINFLAALVLFIVVGLVGWPYLRADVTVAEALPGSPIEQILERGDMVLEVGGERVQSVDEFDDQMKDNVGKEVTLLVRHTDGQIEEIPFTVTAFDLPENIRRVYVTSVRENGPAEKAGFEEEDLIVAVDGIETTGVEQLQEYTQAHEGIEMVVTVVRGSELLDLPVTPEDDDGTPRIGIGIADVNPTPIGMFAINRNTERYAKALPVGEAIKTGTNEFIEAHRLLGEFFSDLIAGNIEPEAARPVSPVGIGQLGGPVLEQSLDEGAMYPIILFAAMISIALAITNLLPIPGLDGGRILFVIIELIRGKPMEPEREGLFHFIGLLFLLGLIAITLVNDIVNPIDLSNLK